MKSFEDKIKEIKEGKNLEEYLHDEDITVRRVVAKSTKDPEVAQILLCDEEMSVITALAENGIVDKEILDQYSEDKEYGMIISKKLARLTEDETVLSALAFNNSYEVRKIIAERGYCHSILSVDEHFAVRLAVARNTKDKELLKYLIKNDDTISVTDAAENRLFDVEEEENKF